MSTTRRTLRHERRRLARVFGALLLAAGSAGAAQACSSSSSPDEADAATPDAQGTDAPAADAPADTASGDTGADADAGSCRVTTGYRDATPHIDDAGDADPGCWWDIPCGLESVGQMNVGCEIYLAQPESTPLDQRDLKCWLVEGQGCTNDAATISPTTPVRYDCYNCGSGGRRPGGLARPRPHDAPSEVAAWFARMAFEEAASVHAFVRMGEELARFGAPADLVRAAARSVRDEERHARVMSRRARACGAPVKTPRVRRRPPRSLEAMARENAVEGCVNETFGALVARFQAEHAKDAPLRRTFARIAADETRHAALSWAVARWAERRLEPAARRRVQRARARAVRTLRAELQRRAPERGDVLGRPHVEAALTLLDGMVAGLDLA